MGTMKFKNEDMIGKKYERLTILDIYYTTSEKGNKYLTCYCECECGNKKEVRKCDITSKRTLSCGCYSRENASVVNTKHGFSNSSNKTYQAWISMKGRCNTETNNKYEYYGARGIKVCEEWYDFSIFLRDMGEAPTNKHSLDRINVDGNYEPSNCRWAVHTRQVVNRRMQKSNKSGVEGIQWSKANKNYIARIAILGKRISLGSYKTIEEATEARRKGEELRESILKEKGI